jgi:hypothetical protein
VRRIFYRYFCIECRHTHTKNVIKMIHTDLSPRLHHSSLAAAALAAAASAEGQSHSSVTMPQSSFPQKTPFAIQELLGLTNDHSDSNDLKGIGGGSSGGGHLDGCSGGGGFSAAAAAAAMVSSSYNNRSFMSQAAHQVSRFGQHFLFRKFKEIYN